MRKMPSQATKQAESSDLVRAVRKALRNVADPSKAPIMQAYMKSEMPYLGVQTTPQRKVYKAVFAAFPMESFEAWREAILELWRDARYREERYAAIELARYKRYREFRTMDALPVYEEIIVTGAWWDYVDSVAAHLLGELLRANPSKMRRILHGWAKSDNIWKRRSAILAQLGFKADTDLELLYDCIRPSLGRPEFFLRKAIGWALRQHAKTDPGEVVRFVSANEKQLSKLSKREALKNCGAGPRPATI